jgi:hypothetical protein
VRRDIEAAERADHDQMPAAYTVLVDISLDDDPAARESLISLGSDLTGGQDPAVVALSDLRPNPEAGLEMGSGMGSAFTDLVESGDRLRMLGTAVTGRGIGVTLLSRFGTPDRSELDRQGAELNAAVLLTTQPWTQPARGDRTVAVVRGTGTGGTDAPVVMVSGADSDTAAAVRLGVAIARSRNTALHLWAVGGSRSERRTQRIAEDLGRIGVRAETVELAGTSLLITPAGQTPLLEPTDGTVVMSVTASMTEVDLDQVAAEVSGT